MPFSKIIKSLVECGAHTAVKYLSEKHVIRATRKAYSGKFHYGQIEVLITDGKPNSLERAFIKKYVKTGGKFPSKIQFKYLPAKKKPK